jgi:hypothetical protein
MDKLNEDIFYCVFVVGAIVCSILFIYFTT